jgi:hypothetical protein
MDFGRITDLLQLDSGRMDLSIALSKVHWARLKMAGKVECLHKSTQHAQKTGEKTKNTVERQKKQ